MTMKRNEERKKKKIVKREKAISLPLPHHVGAQSQTRVNDLREKWLWREILGPPRALRPYRLPVIRPRRPQREKE
jgi:hypothetical protein